MEKENDNSTPSVPLDAAKKPKRQRNGSGFIVDFNSHRHVSQDELIDERVAFQKAMRLYEEWQDRAHAIRYAIEQGASVEEGIWRAQVVQETVKSHNTGFPERVTKLVVW